MNKSFFLAVLATLFICVVLSGCTVRYVEPAPAPTYQDPPPPPPPPPPPAEVEFYELGQYGDWIDVYPHGTVWRPYVAHGWRPYVYGHWAWTDWDWTWISYEPFGWAVYHYGYWQYDSAWGWIWIPGLEWNPVRVQWVYYDDYVCWAPLAPPGYHLPDPWVSHPGDVWIVVNIRHFTNYDLHRFRVQPEHYKYKHDRKYKSKIAVYRQPPPVRLIEKHTRRPIERVHVDTRNYKSGTKTYKKVVLPPSEKRIVRKYEPQVRKRVGDGDGNHEAYKEKEKRAEPQQKKERTTRGANKKPERKQTVTEDKESPDSSSDKKERESGSTKKQKKKTRKNNG